MRFQFIAVSVAGLLTACGPAPSEPSKPVKAVSERYIPGQTATEQETTPTLTGDWIETDILNLFNDSRIMEGTIHDGVVTLRVRMKDTDVGGIVEAGTTPRNIGAMLYTSKTQILPEAKRFRFLVEDKSGRYFGLFLFDRSDLIASRAKPTNYPQIMNMAKEVHLTDVGISGAKSFCEERKAEAQPFCVRALKSMN